MYKCPNCGGEIEFIPENGVIKCQFCDTVFHIDDSQNLEGTRKAAEEHSMEDGKVYTCSQCGANIYTAEDTGVTFCSYCGSQAFLESRINADNIAPDVVIPFRISKEQCLEIYKNKIKRAWFLPKAMKADQAIEKFRGIYMPCWIYTSEAEGKGSYLGKEVTREFTDDVIRTYKINASFTGKWDGFVYDATSSFPDGIMREISPFDLSCSVPFNEKYLAGFYADIGNVPSEAYDADVVSKVDADIKETLLKTADIRVRQVSAADINKGTNNDIKVTRVRKGFLPVWFLSNKNESTGRMSYAVINGLTGKIHADLPVDMKKYLLLALIVAIPVFVLLSFLTIKPNVLLIITMVLLGIMMTFSTKMISEAYIQEHGLDDIGAQYLEDKAPERWDYNKTVTTAKQQKPKTPLNQIPSGVFFIGMPIIASFLSNIVDINLTPFGFGLGIVLFMITRTKPNVTHDQKASFLPGKRKVRLPLLMTLRALALPLVGILAGLVLLAANPPHDLYYYLCAVLCIILLILTVLDFARKNNELSLRKPAQLGKRGGDEDE